MVTARNLKKNRGRKYLGGDQKERTNPGNSIEMQKASFEGSPSRKICANLIRLEERGQNLFRVGR